jgi:hypothetical protein
VPTPETVILTCADGGMTVQHVRWQSWKANLAIGAATVTANRCDPSCADGVFIDYPVTVVLDRVVENGAGPQFTRLTAIYADRSPNVDGTEADAYDLPVATG